MKEKNSFKFRAWLKGAGEMVEVLEIDFYNKEVAYIWTEQVSDYELEQTREVDKIDDLVLMQSTGLKDKNGLEIFEGDILLFDDGDIAHVVKHRGAFWIEGSSVPMAMESHYDIVVRGNIYENRELLEVAEC